MNNVNLEIAGWDLSILYLSITADHRIAADHWIGHRARDTSETQISEAGDGETLLSEELRRALNDRAVARCTPLG